MSKLLDVVTDRQGVEHARLARSKGISRKLYQGAHEDGTMSRVLDAVRDGLPITIGTLVVPRMVEKFDLFVDLSIITVPEDYELVTEFAGGSFPNPTRVLKPGDKFWVRAHKQLVSGTTTSEERMEFLASLNSHHIGAQGAQLVYDQKSHRLPKGYWYASFDEKERLWKDAGRYHRVPVVDAFMDGNFNRRLSSFEFVWDGYDAVLSFCDVPSDT